MSVPLAEKIRPTCLDEIVGQTHLLAKNKPLRRIIDSGKIPNMIFYGSSGIGKTTVARIIADQTHMRLHKLNGTSASTADIKAIVEEVHSIAGYNGILLYLDEIQYLNKKQQQTLLEHIENGDITLIASTTENPYFYIYNAILSRSTVFEFQAVEPGEIQKALLRAVSMLEEEYSQKAVLEAGVLEHISLTCGGDVRKALNSVELCYLSSDMTDGQRIITLELAGELSQRSSMQYDRDGDQHYEILSALHKSVRGSDENAALHYLARLMEAGDLISACRRILAIACEDIGLGYPQAMPIVKSLCDIAIQLGLPEARTPLADAVVLLCTSPKSNSAYNGMDAALADVRAGKLGRVPKHLQNAHYEAESKQLSGAPGYKYPHVFKNHYVTQQYLPDELVGSIYYEFAENKNEQAAKAYRQKLILEDQKI